MDLFEPIELMYNDAQIKDNNDQKKENTSIQNDIQINDLQIESDDLNSAKEIEHILFNKPYWDLNNCIEDSPIKMQIFNKN